MEIPVSAAIERTLQWIEPSFDLVFKVELINAAMRSSDIVRGAPGRISSYSPAILLSMNLCRHLPTVVRVTLNRKATSLFDSPDAQDKTSFVRWFRPAGTDRERAIGSSCCRSSVAYLQSLFRPSYRHYLAPADSIAYFCRLSTYCRTGY